MRVKQEGMMSEFTMRPVEQSFGEAAQEMFDEVYERVRGFAGAVMARAEMILEPQEFESQVPEAATIALQSEATTVQGQRPQTPERPPHICGSSCSRCGVGGSQVKKPGLRR
jgi:hypothetical protein